MKTTISIIIAIIVIGGIYLYAHNSGMSSDTATSTTTVIDEGASSAAPGTTNTTGASASSTVGQVSTADIKVEAPVSGQKVTSPLTVSGQARGNWFFEASAPVYLEDANGKKIAQGTINATGDWMTTNFVPFTGTLTWSATSTGTSTSAFVVFLNDNPSGNPSLQKTVTVPVTLSR